MALGTRGKKAAATKRTLLDAALNVMSREGYAEATIDQIAKEAGVSKGLAYYHFKSKGEIATEILENGINDLIDRFVQETERAQSGSDALKRMLEAFAEVVVGNWQFARFYLSVIWREGRDWSDKIHEVDTRLIAIIAKQFTRGQEDGSFAADLDPEFCAVACIGMVFTTALRYFGIDNEDKPAMSKEEYTSKVSKLVMRSSTAKA